MTFNCYHNEIDISDYVVRLSDIPFIERQRNFEWIVSVMFASISTEYGTDFELADTVSIYADSQCIFCGKVDSAKKSWDNRTWELELSSSIKLLQDIKIAGEDSDLLTYLELGTTDQFKINTLTYESEIGELEIDVKNINLLWLFEAMFNEVGLELDTSALSGVWVRNFTPHSTLRQFNYDDIYIDYQMLLKVNQGSLAEASDNDYKITYFDLLSKIASYFKIIIVPDGEDSFKLYGKNQLSEYSINDNYKYSYSEEDTGAEESNGYIFNIIYSYTTDSYSDIGFNSIQLAYYDTTGWSYNNDGSIEIKDGDEELEITGYNHLIFFLRNKETSPEDFLYQNGFTSGYSSFDYFDYDTTDHSLLNQEIDAEFSDWQIKEIETSLRYDIALVLKHQINIEERVSKITYEVET